MCKTPGFFFQILPIDLIEIQYAQNMCITSEQNTSPYIKFSINISCLLFFSDAIVHSCCNNSYPVQRCSLTIDRSVDTIKSIFLILFLRLITVYMYFFIDIQLYDVLYNRMKRYLIFTVKTIMQHMLLFRKG